MTTLKDGRFMFIHADRHNLLLEQSVKAAAVSPSSTTATTAAAKEGVAAALSLASSTFQLLYGGVVHAFALNATQSHIALVCPAGSAAATSAAAGHLRGDGPSTVLRLFSFSCGEVGELIDELVTAEACDVVWVGSRHLALEVRRFSRGGDGEVAVPSLSTSPLSAPVASTILIEVTKAPEKLRWVRQDEAAASPVSAPGSVLCDIHVGKQSLRFWDLQKGKVMQECGLPNRRSRHGKTRMATATCSDGSFVFVVNDDWTVHGFHVGKRTVRELKPMLSQFESQSVNLANNRGGCAKLSEENNDGHGVTGAGKEAESSMPRPPSKISTPPHKLACPRLFARAINDTQVLLALQGSSTILQCACESKTSRSDEWTVVAKMRLPRRLQATCEVVGLSTRGCLVRQFELTEGSVQTSTAAAPSGAQTGASVNGQNTVAYFVVPLEMKATGKASVAVAVTCGNAGTTERSAATPKTDTVGEESERTSVAPSVPSETSWAEGKRKRKKKSIAVAANSDAPASATSPEAPSASASDTGNAESGSSGRCNAEHPLQRAVLRLLVHAGISGKDQFTGAFAKDTASDGVDTAGAAAAAPAACGHKWHSTDTFVTAGGVVIGVVLGLLVMRHFALL
ncbi:hypothetical protein Q4I32_007068 [Leishmania shawi]|uniref:Uncharacterized protein n=1 Tax=Leishmania shawi TaxID=5680 RepID=A0AAW3BA03_9TRYP